MSAESDAIRSICDVVSELVAGLAAGESPTRGWAYVTIEILADHVRALDGTPLIDPEQVSHWKG